MKMASGKRKAYVLLPKRDIPQHKEAANEFALSWIIKPITDPDDVIRANCSIFISKLGWHNVFPKSRTQNEEGYLSNEFRQNIAPGMPVTQTIHDFGVAGNDYNIGLMCVPEINIVNNTDRLKKLLKELREIFSKKVPIPEQVVRDSDPSSETFGRLGRVIPFIPTSCRIVAQIRNVPSACGLHWSFDLYDARWYARCIEENDFTAFIPKFFGESDALQSRRMMAMGDIFKRKTLIGLRWVNVGISRPAGEEIVNDGLKENLRQKIKSQMKLEVTMKEFTDYKLDGLRAFSYLKLGGAFFRPELDSMKSGYVHVWFDNIVKIYAKEDLKYLDLDLEQDLFGAKLEEQELDFFIKKQ